MSDSCVGEVVARWSLVFAEVLLFVLWCSLTDCGYLLGFEGIIFFLSFLNRWVIYVLLVPRLPSRKVIEHEGFAAGSLGRPLPGALSFHGSPARPGGSGGRRARPVRGRGRSHPRTKGDPRGGGCRGAQGGPFTAAPSEEGRRKVHL